MPNTFAPSLLFHLLNSPNRSRSPVRLFTALICICTVFAATATVSAQQNIPSGPSYEVDLSDARNHYVTITMTANPTGEQTELMMAVWTPGSYLVREYAKHVDRISATQDGDELKIVKTKKNRWQIDTPAPTPFTVTYRIFCKEISVRTNYVDRAYCVLNGAATFITVPEQMDTPHKIRLLLPEVWTNAASSMRKLDDADDDEKHFYIADNYDEVVDSPIVAGNVELFEFKVADVPHFLVNVNDKGNWNGKRAAKDLAKIVEAHHDLWGNVPYDRYYFLNVICDSGGGLEHNNCCLIMSRQTAFRDDNSYERWLSLCSHEFFHTWNIRRLRPKSLVRYDYENEVYTPSLWVAEGVTSYYEDLLLVRADLMSKKDFISGVGRVIRGVQSREGRKVQSLRDSSHDAWIKFYRPEENSRDTQVSYYNKGALAAFLLDIEIRNASGGKHSLDDALRKMYTEYSGNKGYLPDDFRRVCSEFAGVELTGWFESVIDSTDEVDYRNVADFLGVEVGDVLPSNAEQEEEEPEDLPWIGIGETDSPATDAGVEDTDEILAVDNVRLTDNIDSRLEDFEVGDKITLMLSREEEIIEIELAVGGIAPRPRWSMKPSDESTNVQKANRKNWLFATHEEPESNAPKIYKWTKKRKLSIQ